MTALSPLRPILRKARTGEMYGDLTFPGKRWFRPETIGADHPLAPRGILRLRDCAAFPICLPTAQYGVRHLLDMALFRSSIEPTVAVESDSFEFLRRYPGHEQMISFQIPVGLPADQPAEGIVSREVDKRDVPEGLLYLCQLRGRSLAVAPAKFAAQIEGVLDSKYR